MMPSIKFWRQVASTLGIVALTAVPSFAADVWLVAKPLTKTMPDAATVPMWGFAPATTNFVIVGTPTVPGPTITVAPGDPTLTIHLRNDLTTQAVSIVIPGLATALSPVRFTDTQGHMRVKAFTAEAAANGGTQNYTFTARPGTFLYQSGSHPSTQVPMGLYGAVKANASATQIYTGVTFDNEAVLLYSEVDPALNIAVNNNTFGTPAYPGSINFTPTYFLVNGDPYPRGGPVVAHAPLTGERVLLRLLNAGLKSHIPTLQAGRMQVVAEDGNPYPFQRDEYDVLLPAGKTTDAVLTVTATGLVPIYDRALNLTNAGQTGGGLLANVAVGQTASMFQQGLAGSAANSANIDTNIRASAATTNYGTDANLYVGTTTPATSTYRSILEFNLASIPVGVNVTGCTLTVNVNQRTSPTEGHIRRVCGQHWLDGDAQSETQATWNRWRSPNSNTWGTPGASTFPCTSPTGDYDTAAEVAYTPPLATGTYTFPDLTPLCQDAITAQNRWLRLRVSQDSEATLNNFMRLTSSDGTPAASRPKLTVTWSVPTTTTTSTSTSSSTTTSTSSSTTTSTSTSSSTSTTSTSTSTTSTSSSTSTSTTSTSTSTTSTSSSTSTTSTSTSTTSTSIAGPTTTSTSTTSTSSSTTTSTSNSTTTSTSNSTTTSTAVSTTTSTTLVAPTVAVYQAGVSAAGTADVDTYLRLSTPTQNYNTDPFVIVGLTNAANKVNRTLMAFNLQGIPASAVVTGCTLQVNVTQRTSPTAGRIRRLCSEHWLDGDGQSEAQATWNAWKTGFNWGSPGAATAGCAGGDYDPTGEVTYTPPAGTGLFTFPSLTALCQDAVASRTGQLRLRITQDAETTQSNLIKFDSSEATTAANRPKLTVTWHP